MNTPFGNSITTAEHAIALMFALARQIPAADASTQAGKWEKNRFMGVELTGKTLGIIGCGNIGSIVADARPRPEDARRSPSIRSSAPSAPRELGVEKVELDELLARADFITLHTPLTDADQEHPLRREPRQDQEGRAHHQLRARRPGRRGGAARGARQRPCRRRGLRRLRRGAGDGEPAVRPSQRRRHAASRRLDHARRRRTSRCRSPSRCRTI